MARSRLRYARSGAAAGAGFRSYAGDDHGGPAPTSRCFIEAGAQPEYAPARARLRVDASPYGRELSKGQAGGRAGAIFLSIGGLQRVAASVAVSCGKQVSPVRAAGHMRTLYLGANGLGARSLVTDQP